VDFRAVGFRSPTIIGWPKTAVRLMLEHDPDPAEPKFNQSGQPCSSHTDHLRELPMSPEAVAHSDHRVGMTEPGAAILSGKHVACRITCEPDAGAKIALDDAVALPERFRVRFSGSQREALVQLISQEGLMARVRLVTTPKPVRLPRRPLVRTAHQNAKEHRAA